MKKILLTLAVVSLCFAGSGAFAAGTDGKTIRGTIVDKLALYLPNRLLDLMDAFTINVGVGPVLEARLMGTRFADCGAGVGMCYKAFKAHNRQIGVGVEEFWYWSLISIGDESYTLTDTSDWVDRYVEMRAGVPDPTARVYDFFSGPRDYWAIGGALGGGLDGEVYIHPVEWIDLALGFLLIDIKNDDMILDDFR